MLPEYDDLSTDLLSLSVLGKQHREGIVMYEYQVTQLWEQGALDNWWIPTQDLAGISETRQVILPDSNLGPSALFILE